MLLPKSAHVGFLVLSGALSLACYEQASPGVGGMTGSGGGGGTVGTATTGGDDGTGGTTTTTGSGPAIRDLFACQFPISCLTCTHLCANTCVESLWIDDEGGTWMSEARIGPAGYSEDTLYLLSRDGKVLEQGRSRNQEENLWSLRAQRLCDAGANAGALENCEAVNYSCDEARASLESAGGAGGDASAE